MEFCTRLSVRRWLMKDSTSGRFFTRANEGVTSNLLAETQESDKELDKF